MSKRWSPMKDKVWNEVCIEVWYGVHKKSEKKVRWKVRSGVFRRVWKEVQWNIEKGLSYG